LDPAQTVISKSGPATDPFIYYEHNTTTVSLASAWTITPSYCGPYTYSVAFSNGTTLPADLFTAFDPTTGDLTLSTTNTDHLGTHSVTITGLRAYSQSDTLTYTLEIKKGCA